MARKLIFNGRVASDNEIFEGFVTINGSKIERVVKGIFPADSGLEKSMFSEVIDARGGIIMPGVIDDQVHFRTPGLTHKGDIHSESRAGVAGGVTSFMDMPNTKPPTITLQDLDNKFEIASKDAMSNYSFYIGGTNDNADIIRKIDTKRVCGIKLFLGSSTGNMLVDSEKALDEIFSEASIPVAIHSEDETIIQANIAEYRKKYGDDNITPSMHPLIRSAEACYISTARAIERADKRGTHLHVLHISTARELELFSTAPIGAKKITSEVCGHHLWFSDKDYALRGNNIKWNPSIKSLDDREALRKGLIDGRIDIAATDHAPHTKEEKAHGGYFQTPSGGPLLQHSLPLMLEMWREGIFTLETVIEKMCHAPALLFAIDRRGYLREGYFADIAIVDTNTEETVNEGNILYKCGWSPLEGITLHNKVSHTIINGEVVYKNGQFNEEFRGSELIFNR